MTTLLQQNLEYGSPKKIKLKINDNRSTMLSVRWRPDCTIVSLHKMFLDAPQNIMDALACYVRKEKKQLSNEIRAFIEDRLKQYDYTHELDLNKLDAQGNVYNLQKIYAEVNNEYFDNQLQLYITWFGIHAPRIRHKITYGLYYHPLKLIKINRLLDNPFVPNYVVAFVVYHEMVHHVCPSYFDPRGFTRVHSKEFKERERQFKQYALSKKWIQEHTKQLFKT